jgi:hypothetical protein
MKHQLFEVETRVHFQDEAELFEVLPFLQSCFNRRTQWETVHYGLEKHYQDEVLRIGKIFKAGEIHYYLGWKGPDQGSFANIRAELDEEITHGVKESEILAKLGGRTELPSYEAVLAELHLLELEPFMAFSGENSWGFYEPDQIDLKLMQAPALIYPCLLEAEKKASTIKDAKAKETDLRRFAAAHNLLSRIIRAEPPTLLWQNCHPQSE